jgi:tRNA pseudouridine65 synthase
MPDHAPEDRLEVLYRDDDLVAVHKPAGLLVHRTELDRHERRVAVQLVRNQLRAKVFPVHRLDRGTSGVLVLALSSAAARTLVEAFKAGQVDKSYLAVVRGYLPVQGLVDYPLVEEFGPGLKQQRAPQEARTWFERLGTAEVPMVWQRHATLRYSLALVRPHTGRTHQIRRHFKHIFHPVLGDVRHGDGRQNRWLRELTGCSRLLLHAWRISLPHPGTGERVEVTAPLDRDFRALLERLGWGELAR